jgi:deoxyribodipyrimidine photo-lyase
MWFRRDLRLSDNPALLAAIESGEEIVLVFILDPKLIKITGEKGLAYLAQSLRSLDESLGNKLIVREGDPVDVLKDLKKKYDATSVHIATEYDAYAVARDARVEAAGIELTRTGSPYAVAPGRVKKPSDATNYRVYTPFYRGWLLHGWRAAVAAPKSIKAVTPDSSDRNFPTWQVPEGTDIPVAGEKAAHERFKKFKAKGLDSYDETRNFAGIDGTSKMSAHLTWGEIHPRTLLAGLEKVKLTTHLEKKLRGANFMQMFCSTIPIQIKIITHHNLRICVMTNQVRNSKRGVKARLDTHLLMQACVNWLQKAGCTIACAWLLLHFLPRIYISNGSTVLYFLKNI